MTNTGVKIAGVLVLGDSLTFGRPKYGICRDSTWPYLIARQMNCELQLRSRGGSTIIDVKHEAEALKSYWCDDLSKPVFNCLIVQVGIVDCCPRICPRSLYRFVNKIPGFNKLERNRIIHQIAGRPWVNEETFKKSLKELREVAKSLAGHVFYVEIAKPVHNLIENVGDFTNITHRYNNLIKDQVGSEMFVEWCSRESLENMILPDGHHLNKLGHEMVADACIMQIRGCK